MKPLFSAAKRIVREGGPARIVFAEGEDERVLRAVQVVVDEGLARPILVPPAQAADPHRELFAAAPGRRRRPTRIRRALPPVLDDLLGAQVPPWHHQGNGARRNAPPHDPDRRDDGAPGRCRRYCSRHGRRLSPPPALVDEDFFFFTANVLLLLCCWPPAGPQCLCRHEHPAAQRAHGGAGGHARQR